MTITELIKTLEKYKKDWGEKEVCIPHEGIFKPVNAGGLYTPHSGAPYIILYYDNN